MGWFKCERNIWRGPHLLLSEHCCLSLSTEERCVHVMAAPSQQSMKILDFLEQSVPSMLDLYCSGMMAGIRPRRYPFIDDVRNGLVYGRNGNMSQSTTTVLELQISKSGISLLCISQPVATAEITIHALVFSC